MKYLLSFLLAFSFVAINESIAQEETKKVIVIKKVKDKDGNVSTEKTEASGTEADELIKELKKDGSLDGIDIEVEIEKAKKSGNKSKRISKTISEDISIEKEVKNGEESVTYTITTDDNGAKKVMVWKGDGEMPKEMAEKMKKHEIHQFKTEDGEEMIFISEDEDFDHHEKEVRVHVKRSPNKVSLGVMITDEQGVVIDNVVEGSVAEKVGLQIGDTILKVDDTYIFNTDMLLDALSVYDLGDSTKIRYLRKNKEKSVKVKF